MNTNSHSTVSPPAAGTLDAMRGIFMRDVRLAMRRRADTAAALFFFVIVASLFPLGVGPEPALLRTMAAGVVWVAALLASMLSLGRLFAGDHADTNDQASAQNGFLAIVIVHAEASQTGNLQKVTAPINQLGDTFAWQQGVALFEFVAFARRFVTDFLLERAYFSESFGHPRNIGSEIFRAGVNAGDELRHD